MPLNCCMLMMKIANIVRFRTSREKGPIKWFQILALLGCSPELCSSLLGTLAKLLELQYSNLSCSSLLPRSICSRSVKSTSRKSHAEAASSGRARKVSHRGDGGSHRSAATANAIERHANMINGVRHESEESMPSVP